MTAKRPCPCEGHTLDRLLQPTVMAILAEGPQHGYSLVERLRASPLMNGAKPNDTGVYRLLAALEELEIVRHSVAESDRGPSKTIYQLTESGKECLATWISTLDGYQRAIAELVATMQRNRVCRSSVLHGNSAEPGGDQP